MRNGASFAFNASSLSMIGLPLARALPGSARIWSSSESSSDCRRQLSMPLNAAGFGELRLSLAATDVAGLRAATQGVVADATSARLTNYTLIGGHYLPGPAWELLAARYHDETPGGRAYRFVLCGHPVITRKLEEEERA